MELRIMVNLEMTFRDGLSISGNRVTANDTSLANVASQINTALARLSGAELQAALTRVRSDWQWTGPTDPRIVGFMSRYRQTVQDAWSSAGTGLVFQSSRDGWDSQLARVVVDVDTVNATPPLAAANGRQPTHCQANIFKTKEGRTDYGAAVGGGSPNSGTDQTLWLGSSDVATEQHLLTTSVFFANNSAALSNDTKARLRRWIISFQAPAGGSGTTLDIIGRANTVGGGSAAGDEYNRQLSLRRAQAVANFIRTERVEGRTLENVTTRLQSTTGSGATGATDTAYWRRVDIVAAGGQGQNIAAHEFGHMIGLHDEYASTPQRDAAGRVVTDAQGDPVSRGLISGTGGDVGQATGHNQLAQDMGVGGSVYENNDNIMSLGSTIRPQHYATFMEALRTVTSINEWRMQQ
jgi:outer membrane protein OmpA-like peptidoglycan-associated protein